MFVLLAPIVHRLVTLERRPNVRRRVCSFRVSSQLLVQQRLVLRPQQTSRPRADAAFATHLVVLSSAEEPNWRPTSCQALLPPDAGSRPYSLLLRRGLVCRGHCRLQLPRHRWARLAVAVLGAELRVEEGAPIRSPDDELPQLVRVLVHVVVVLVLVQACSREHHRQPAHVRFLALSELHSGAAAERVIHATVAQPEAEQLEEGGELLATHPEHELYRVTASGAGW